MFIRTIAVAQAAASISPSLVRNDYAEEEFNDLVDAKRHLVEKGLADAKRVGISGGSYGGYASMWSAAALSEEYAAAVAFVGISNQVSKFGTGDIPYEMYNVHAPRVAVGRLDVDAKAEPGVSRGQDEDAAADHGW